MERQGLGSQNSDDAVLVVCPSPQTGCGLVDILGGARFKVLHSRDCLHALLQLNGSNIAVVICESSLPDGDWKDMLEHMQRAGSAAMLIVTSRLADDSLWAEVLNLGGYDLLAQPFHREEAIRVVASAVYASSRYAPDFSRARE